MFGCFESTGIDLRRTPESVRLPIQSLLHIFRLSYLFLPEHSDRRTPTKSTMPSPTSETMQPSGTPYFFFFSLSPSPSNYSNAASIFRLHSKPRIYLNSTSESTSNLPSESSSPLRPFGLPCSIDDQLFHERYHDVSKVLNVIIEIAAIQRPSRLARIMPTFESQTSPEQDKQMLEGWRDRLLRELWQSEDAQWNFVDEGNYGRIKEMIGKLREAATSKKLVSFSSRFPAYRSSP